MIAIGGLAGALASIATTPADVLKTRMMTAAAAESVSIGAILVRRYCFVISYCPSANLVRLILTNRGMEYSVQPLRS